MRLFGPDDFRRDPYGFLTNQVSHIGLGVVLAWMSSAVVFLVLGELPYRSTVFLVILGGYIFYEVRRQAWQGWDTIEDTLFVVGYGAGGVLYSFTEAMPGSSKACVDLLSPIPFLAAAALHLAIGFAIRLYQKSQHHDG